jgi:hypothetical protein
MNISAEPEIRCHEGLQGIAMACGISSTSYGSTFEYNPIMEKLMNPGTVFSKIFGTVFNS